MENINLKRLLKALMPWTVSCFMAACSNHVIDKSAVNNITTPGNTGTIQEPDTSKPNGPSSQKTELTKIYTKAIAEFIKASYKNDKTSFDTLFFGKHVYGQPDDFPDIELPETIVGTHVRLITPEAGLKKQQERKSLAYINMMGWVDKEKAGFVFVVFSNGSQHQYDYFIDFTYRSARKAFELEIQFEDYRHNKEEKPKRITIYKDGKYVDRIALE